MSTMMPPQWANTVLREVGLDATPHRLTALAAWAHSKHMPTWTHNPLACGVVVAHSRKLTESGIQGYDSWRSGILATVDALRQPEAQAVRLALRAEHDYRVIHAAIRTTSWPWVTHDSEYPAMLRYLGELREPHTGRINLPVITDGLHGGYPRERSHAHTMAATRHMRTTIGQLSALSHNIRWKMNRGSKNG